MKKLLSLLAALLLAVNSASAFPYEEAARKAYYLTDKMAYELNLSDAQYDRVYQINFDYFLKCAEVRDIEGYLWEYRNTCLARVLYTAQWRIYNSIDHFFRPIRWVSGRWYFPVREHYGHHRYYRPAPPPSYKGPRPGEYHKNHNTYYGPGGHANHNDGYRPGANSNRGGYRDSGNRGQSHGTPAPNNNGGHKTNTNTGHQGPSTSSMPSRGSSSSSTVGSMPNRTANSGGVRSGRR